MSEMTIQNVVEAFNATTTKLAKDLTKREYFAALAMQGMLSADDENDWTAEQIAEWSCQCADALLAELAEEKKEGANYPSDFT